MFNKPFNKIKKKNPQQPKNMWTARLQLMNSLAQIQIQNRVKLDFGSFKNIIKNRESFPNYSLISP